MDDATALVELAVYGSALLFALVCCAKGKFWLALLFLIGPLIVGVGAIRLAKPKSPWANRFYSREKMGEAVERFPEDADGVALDPGRAGPDAARSLDRRSRDRSRGGDRRPAGLRPRRRRPCPPEPCLASGGVRRLRPQALPDNSLFCRPALVRRGCGRIGGGIRTRDLRVMRPPSALRLSAPWPS